MLPERGAFVVDGSFAVKEQLVCGLLSYCRVRGWEVGEERLEGFVDACGFVDEGAEDVEG